jgi:hypothetical protein
MRKKTTMKTKTTLMGAAIWLTLLGLLSCEDEPEQAIAAESSIVRFGDTEVTISENQHEKRIVLNLSKSAVQAGTISLEITSNHLTRFTTEPASTDGRIELPVVKGSNSISFLVKPVNDLQWDGDKTLSAFISEVSSGFQIGTPHSFSVTILDDEESADRVEANFMVSQIEIGEQASEGSEITVSLSGSASAAGQIGIRYSSVNAGYGIEIRYGVDFITEPAAENGEITLALATGSNQVTFKFIPINNQVWLGDRSMVFNLASGQGSVRLGQRVDLQLKITDDELAPKIKSYETAGGGWKVKRSYEYGYDNNLDKVTWEQYTPAYVGGTYRYEYQQGRLHKMVEDANRETFYLWEDERIVKEEQYTAGVLKKYVLYNYDQAGNIGEAAFHYRQPDGTIKMGLLIVFLYYTDGNLYKKMVYNPVNGLENLSLISTVTYENYLDVENPFPLEILPNVNSQPKLPGTYREEANGNNTVFNFTYEFDDQGRPLKRTASSNIGSEVTTYRYH